MIISVPALEEEPWPTLGELVCDWIEAYLVFGPGDLEHEPARIDDEKRALIYRCYEVYPQGWRDENNKPIGGRRRFRRCALSLQKGSAKTELAAWLAAVELAPDGPVRCDGFDAWGRPVGRPVSSPYIPMVAYTEEQSSDLAYGVLLDILDHSPCASAFDIGMERITRAGEPRAKAVALAGAPSSRDGALTTFQHKDETHRWNTNRLRNASTTMQANLPKRLLAEPWELETTTAYVPGEDSVAERTARYAEQVREGKIHDSRLFFFHRQASDGYDMTDPAQIREAVIEAAGPQAEWKDIDGIVDTFQDPTADVEYLERVWCNRPLASSAQAFDGAAWERNKRPMVVERRTAISLGFDGSRTEDSTALIATVIATGYQWPIKIWEKPLGPLGDGWEVPEEEVDEAVDEAFRTYRVRKFYLDRSKWEKAAARWAGRWGQKIVVFVSTTSYRQMGQGLRAYAGGIKSGEITNNGDPAFARHIGNAQRNTLAILDDDGVPLWIISKDRPGSPNKIDAAMAGMLSFLAALDAIADGALRRKSLGLTVLEDE